MVDYIDLVQFPAVTPLICGMNFCIWGSLEELGIEGGAQGVNLSLLSILSFLIGNIKMDKKNGTSFLPHSIVPVSFNSFGDHSNITVFSNDLRMTTLCVRLSFDSNLDRSFGACLGMPQSLKDPSASGG